MSWLATGESDTDKWMSSSGYLTKAERKPTLSIVLAVYNVASYLRDCLDSIFLSEGVDFEVVAVNDCSPDGSLAILRDYARRYDNVKVLDFPQNRGVSAARNAALRECGGEWVLFMDSDDALVPRALRTLKNAIDGTLCDVITFDYEAVIDIRQAVRQKKSASYAVLDMDDVDVATDYFRKIFPHKLWAWNKCIRRSLIGDLRFRNFQPCEDAIFTLECICRARKIVVLSDVLYKYLQHDGSCMHRMTAKRVQGDINGLSGLFDVSSSWKFYLNVRRFVRLQLESCFLRGIPANIERLRSLGDENADDLEGQFFASATHVFVDSNICSGAWKLAYRFVLSRRSFGVLSIYLRLIGRVRSVMTLPRRVCRKVKRSFSIVASEV